jgi:hypothetical protein
MHEYSLKRSFSNDKLDINNNINTNRNVNQLQFPNPLLANQINKSTSNGSAFNSIYPNKPENTMPYANGFMKNFGYTQPSPQFSDHSKELKQHLYSNFLANFPQKNYSNTSIQMDHLQTLYDSEVAAKAAAINYSNMILDPNSQYDSQFLLNEMSDLLDQKLKMQKLKMMMIMPNDEIDLNFKRAKISNFDPLISISNNLANDVGKLLCLTV